MWMPLHHDKHTHASKDHFTDIRVKVDSGADANLMPVHHFRTIFPYLCDSSGQPNEGVLEKAESSFELYSRDNVTVIGQTKVYARNIQTRKFIET